MGEMNERHGMGWLPDHPDFRDYTPEHEAVAPMIAQANLADLSKVGLPASHLDLKEVFPPIENQGRIGSCTANAAVALVEYFERRAFGNHIDASRLFLYKVTRNLLHWTGDTGAYIRSAMGALVLFGVPPEEYWAYETEEFDEEPPAFCYAFAQNYRAINYVRLDPPGIAKDELLDRIKAYIVAGLPSMFGFTVYSSISQAATTGRIPYPTPGERRVGGHAIVALGYDDNMKIQNTNPEAEETTGALLIRNSWGTGWGDSGYGWFPYKYVLQGLAIDWWSLIKSDWIDTGVFKL